MERKYQVFISSTYEDLKEERKEIIQALLEMDCIPTGMEMFQASDDSQWELIKSVIFSCDYYIVIIAGRYGTIHPITQKSYTQMEYEYASEIGIPIIAFLHENIEELPANKVEKNKKNQKKLQHFREITENKMVKYWSNKSELASVVSRAMYKIFKTHPRNGWIRSEEYINTTDDLIIETLNEIKHQIHKQLNKKSNKNINDKKEIITEDSFWKKYKFYMKCIQNPEFELFVNDKLILGNFHIETLKEIARIILVRGFESFADFFNFTLIPGYVSISFSSNLNDIRKIINYNANSYFSNFECIFPGIFCLNFYDGILNKINILYNLNRFFNIKNDNFTKLALYELGSIFVGNSLVSLSIILNQKITISNYGLCKKIFEKDFWEENNQYLICELQDDNKEGEKFIDAYMIVNIKQLKIMFEILNLYI